MVKSTTMNDRAFTNVTGSIFRNVNGTYRTESLFYEFCHAYPDIEPLYTIRDEEYQGYPSAKKVYLETNDPTEYEQSQILTESWQHWLKLLGNKRIYALICEWRGELEVKLRSQAIQALRRSDKGSDQKWLADRGWQDRQVGRPTKQAKETEAKIAREIDEDLARIGFMSEERQKLLQH